MTLLNFPRQPCAPTWEIFSWKEQSPDKHVIGSNLYKTSIILSYSSLNTYGTWSAYLIDQPIP